MNEFERRFLEIPNSYWIGFILVMNALLSMIWYLWCKERNKK